MEDTTGVVVYTIGHSNHPLDTFLRLLEDNRIEVLIDTRSQPRSAYSPQFNLSDLKAAVEDRGIRYGFYGRELGGRPEGERFYDGEGFVLYGEVARSALFGEGIARLRRGIEKHRVALLCSEEDPSVCHRRLLITRVLAGQGVAVHHIRGDGRIQSEEELRLAERGGLQAELFAPEEVAEWKSLRSVLPRARRPTSSAG